MHRTIDHLILIRNAPIRALNVCGGVACNKTLLKDLNYIANLYEMPLATNPKEFCTDNAAMIAWMGWEVKNAKMDVDLRKFKNSIPSISYHKLPLGNHAIDLINIKSKILRTMKQIERNIK